MGKITFAFAIHDHQPVGNFDYVNEDAYLHSYLPFIEELEKHPKIKMGLHITGILHEWFGIHHPEFLQKIKKMVSTNQVQMLSGGYYEPILSVIPPEDRIGQIEKQNALIRTTLDAEARGMWLAERVWEPTLPSYMAKAGMEYTVIDDIHFKYAGLQADQLHQYYVTEDLGHKIHLFPISQELRYLMPFQKPEKTIEFLKNLAADDEDKIVVFADDGEKFGLWPDTYKHVYEEGWLATFFTLLEDNSDWIEMKHFSEILDTTAPAGNIYLPTASYAEMLHWALPNTAFAAYEEFENTLKETELFEKYGVFVRGGFWRNFFTKYTESNNLHKKMMRVADKVQNATVEAGAISRASDHLWAGQCNCPYWHGVFGGLYLPHLRTAIYENLIASENLVDWQNGENYHFYHGDHSRSGHDELVIETKYQNIFLSLSDGGTVFEHDLRDKLFNIQDAMTRRAEGYHKKLLDMKKGHDHDAGEEVASIHDLVVAKEPDLDKKLFYDRYRNRKFRLYWLDQTADKTDFYQATEKILNPLSELHFILKEKKETATGITLLLVAGVTLDKTVLSISKEVNIPFDALGLSYKITMQRLSGPQLEGRLGISHFYSMLGGASDDRYFFSPEKDLAKPTLNSHLELKATKSIGLVDEWKKLKIQLNADRNVDYWVYPVETISLSESGFERVYQASAIFPVIEVKLFEDTFGIEFQEVIENI
jgi:hypothetical protein